MCGRFEPLSAEEGDDEEELELATSGFMKDWVWLEEHLRGFLLTFDSFYISPRFMSLYYYFSSLFLVLSPHVLPRLIIISLIFGFNCGGFTVQNSFVQTIN